MKEQFVTYEIALKLKELGFDEECLGIYLNKEFRIAHFKHQIEANIGVSAPLWQQAQDFLREKYNLHIEFYYLPLSEKWNAEVYRLDEDILGESVDLASTYTQVRETAILKAIEICKKI